MRRQVLFCWLQIYKRQTLGSEVALPGQWITHPHVILTLTPSPWLHSVSRGYTKSAHLKWAGYHCTGLEGLVAWGEQPDYVSVTFLLAAFAYSVVSFLSSTLITYWLCTQLFQLLLFQRAFSLQARAPRRMILNTLCIIQPVAQYTLKNLRKAKINLSIPLSTNAS